MPASDRRPLNQEPPAAGPSTRKHWSPPRRQGRNHPPRTPDPFNPPALALGRPWGGKIAGGAPRSPAALAALKITPPHPPALVMSLAKGSKGHARLMALCSARGRASNLALLDVLLHTAPTSSCPPGHVTPHLFHTLALVLALPPCLPPPAKILLPAPCRLSSPLLLASFGHPSAPPGGAPVRPLINQLNLKQSPFMAMSSG